MKRGAALVASIPLFGAVRTGIKGPLTLDPNRTVEYTESQLSGFYPPEMTITMGAVPTDFFSPPSNLAGVVIPDPPVIN